MKRFTKTDEPNIKFREDSGLYYFRGTVSGCFIEKSLKTKSFNQAKDRAKKVIASAMGADIGMSLSAKKRYRFSEAFDLVLKIQATKSPATYDQTRYVIEPHLRPWFEKHCPFLDRMERSYEEIWAEYQLDQLNKKKPRKLGHDRRYLTMTLRRAYNKGWIKKQFGQKDFTLNETDEPIGKYMTDQEVTSLIVTCEPYPKLKLQIMMAVYMGMRISEILHLHKDEVDLGRREINLDPHRIKIRRPREVPIPIADDIYPSLKAAYLAAPGPYIFPAWFTNIPGRPIDPNQPQDDNRYYWDKIRELTGLEFRFHDFRHTAITNALKKGMPDYAVRKIMGVSEKTMRRVYAHIEDQLREQFRGMFSAKFVQHGGKYGNLREIK